MILFLTSSFLPYQKKEEYKPQPLLGDNGFTERLGTYWKKHTNMLIVASDPEESEDIRAYHERELMDAFTLSDLPIKAMKTYDHGCGEDLEKLLSWADVVYLAGGHAPTQNAFFHECGLREKIAEFDGIVLGLSAGSANCGEDVYLFPEMSGEAKNPEFQRSGKGLGLTGMQIMPHRQFFLDAKVDGLSVVEDILLPDSQGRRIYFIDDGSYFFIKNGVTEFFGTGETVINGKRKKLHQGIVAAENRQKNSIVLQKLARDNYELVVVLDSRDGNIVYELVGENFLKYGLTPGELYNQRRLTSAIAKHLVVEEEKQPFLEQTRVEMINAEIRTQKEYVRTVHFLVDGDRKALGIRIRPIREDGILLIGTMQDIESIIDHDWMTDELARSGFLRDAKKLWANGTIREGYSLVYTNIKGFKAINDIFGQQSGDMVIFAEKDVLRKHLHPLLMGRLESEHFVMICKNEDLTHERLLPLSQQEFTQEYKRYRYSIRLGICNISEENVPGDQLLDRAKLAETSMSATDHNFYNRYDEKLREEYVNQRLLLSDMKEGLRTNQFVVYYQPIVDLKTGRICSAEALVRWNHPRLGFISPGTFIPVFENAGEISRLDYFIFQEVYKFEQKCLEHCSQTVPVAINLSRMDFYDPMLLTTIIDKVAELGLNNSPVNVEVTESAYAILERDAIGYLNHMKEKGVRILLDDYGSGMSSLSTLESFAFDIVKLDMGFIRKIGMSSKAEAIITSTIALAHAIGSKVTAEGVETEEQLDFLRAAGCDMIQGYYFYKPMPQQGFAQLLIEQRKAMEEVEELPKQ